MGRERKEVIELHGVLSVVSGDLIRHSFGYCGNGGCGGLMERKKFGNAR